MATPQQLCPEKPKSPNEPTDGTKTFVRKPVVLSNQRFNKLLANSIQLDKKRNEELEEEIKWREYLKKGNEELVAKFKGNIQRTQEDKFKQVGELLELKNERVKKKFEMSKDLAEQDRREKVARAQDLIERLKPGPRELVSAALQSEVLRARNVQRTINEEFEKAIKKQECRQRELCEAQSCAYIADETKTVQNHKNTVDSYKRELLQTINENCKNRNEVKKQNMKEEKAVRDALDIEIKNQIEKERNIMAKKREAMRKNALEAMKMVEQRRLRERANEEIEDKLCRVYIEGKHQITKIEKEKAKELAINRERALQVTSEHLAKLKPDVEAIEEARHRRDISTMSLKFSDEEKEKIRKEKAAKKARIEAYLRETQDQKDKRNRMREERRFDIANRLKNEEVNCLFDEAQKQQRIRKVQDYRNSLKLQLEDKKAMQLAEKEADWRDHKFEKEDHHFFDYAHTLLDNAQKRNRPIYPFIKIVNDYKRANRIEYETKTPKHLVSNINIGVRPSDANLDDKKLVVNKAVEAMVKCTGNKKDLDRSPAELVKCYKDSVIENCRKIDQIIYGSNSAEDLKLCAPKCPAECYPKRASKTDCNEILKDDPFQQNLRYSVSQLKEMNQYAAPTPQ